MKKFKFLAAAVVAGVAALSLASCSKVSESYADKIMEEATDGDDVYITLDKVRKDLGDDIIVDLADGAKSGAMIAVNDSLEDLKEKFKADENYKAKALFIAFLDGNATSAIYKEATAKQLGISLD